jgi:hypothetical protein
VGRSTLLIALALLVVAADAFAADVKPPWPARKRRSEEGPLRPGVHEVKDPKRWPAEPDSPPAPIDGAKFRAAFTGMCEAMAPARVLARISDEILQVAGEAKVDPFLLAALVYRESRCVPTLVTPVRDRAVADPGAHDPGQRTRRCFAFPGARR